MVPFISLWAGEKGESRKKEVWSSNPLWSSKERTLPFGREWKQSTRECNYNKLRSIPHDPVPEKYSPLFLCCSADFTCYAKEYKPLSNHKHIFLHLTIHTILEAFPLCFFSRLSIFHFCFNTGQNTDLKKKIMICSLVTMKCP